MKVPDPIGDLRAIVATMEEIRESLALLPTVAGTLAEIQDGVKFMADEVHKMRTGVDVMQDEVKGMRGAVDPMVEHLDAVAEQVRALEPRLEDLSLAIHPLRRATGKLGRRRANGEAELDGDQTSSGENVSQDAGSAEE
jgi:hypothetical protein